MVCDSSEGPECLWTVKANPTILLFFGLFSGRKNWERPRNMRAPQRAPSQCNISERTVLFLFTAFLQETNNLRKKQKLHEKRNTEDHRKCDGWTLAALWLILLLHCVFSRYGWTFGEIWHYLHGIFALFIDFFSLDYKKGKKNERRPRSKGFLFLRRL